MKKINKMTKGFLFSGGGLFIYSFIINEIYSYDYTIIPFFQFPAIAGILLSFILIGISFILLIVFFVFNKSNKN